jgi:hypothetical protein
VQVFTIGSGGNLKFTKSFGSAGAADNHKASLNVPSACALSDTECFVSDTGKL